MSDNHGNPNNILVIFVINGNTYNDIEINVKAILHSVIQKVLKQTNNLTKKIEDWRLTFNDVEIDLSTKASDAGIIEGSILFLDIISPGGGGSYEPDSY